MKEIANYTAVCEAANTLISEGVEPSILAVQSRIGRGSYTTVKKHLMIWAEQRAKEVSTVPAMPAEILGKAQDFGRSVWALAVTEAQFEVQIFRESVQADVAAAQKELAEATGEIARLEGVEAELSASLESSNGLLRKAELSLVEAQTTAAQLPALLKDLADARATTQTTQAALIQKSTEVGQLTGELNALRGQLRDLMAALKK